MLSIFSSMNRRRLIPPIISTLALLLTPLALPGSVASAHTVTVPPGPLVAMGAVNTDPAHTTLKGYFIITGEANSRYVDQVRVKNDGNARGTMIVYAVDATTSQNSGAIYRSQQDPRSDVGAWIHLDATKVTLDPGQSQLISFEVNVPKDARPGNHVGGIIATLLQRPETVSSGNTTNGQSLTINITSQVVLAVQINIPGKTVENLTATDIKPGGRQSYQWLQVGLQNTGDLMLKPQGKLIVKNSKGKTVQNVAVHLNTFLPQTGIEYPAHLKNPALGVGSYKAYLTLKYGHNHMLHFTKVFSVSDNDFKSTITDANGPLPPLAPVSSDSSVNTPVIIGTFGAALVIIGLFAFWQRRRLLQEISRFRNH